MSLTETGFPAHIPHKHRDTSHDPHAEDARGMPQAPALQPRSPTGTDEGGWEEEEGGQQDFVQPSGQAKGATAAAWGWAQPLQANRLLLALSFGCVSPSVLFQARELPFNSSRKQLRNLCFF